MPAALEPLKAFKCTYEHCDMSFDTERAMKRHKSDFEEHDYCAKCDLDCEDPEAFAYHKILEPEKHDLACRLCGDEKKTKSGLSRHTERNHPLDQRLTCPGCHSAFRSPHLFIQHIEFGHCDFISASQFQGHVVHKHLITELLDNREAYTRFQQKQAKYEAALDCDEEGGVGLGDEMFEDEDIEDVKFKAIKPDTPPDTPLSPEAAGPFPPLPSQARTARQHEFDTASDVMSDLESDLVSLVGGLSMDGISISGDSEASTVVNSPVLSPVPATHLGNSVLTGSSRQGSSIVGSTTASSRRQPKVWGSRTGKKTSDILFPGAKPTPAPSDFSIEAYDKTMEKENGLNMMRTRFWDPTSGDWNPERFFDAVLGKYYCPFNCEQSFRLPVDLNHHIMNDHRITRVKCPTCLKYFKTTWQLIAHCESRVSKCDINKAHNYNIFLDRISGGFLEVEEKVRPDHLNNPTKLIHNKESGRMEKYTPPVSTFLQYTVTKPPDWKEPVRVAKVIGGIPSRNQW